MHSVDYEILALRYALESFKLFIIGKADFTIRTDCLAIVRYFTKMKNEKKRSAINRWHNVVNFIQIRGFKPSFEHVQGKHNKIADTLSRKQDLP
ncbi:hypothetical protein K2173_014741 [Erythroxylum novogranatense]|uniref:Reverse transcriptase RNase H-like domain-containing protein n=1 Tax=Erythroxylum novogranatense TaxID=1862640 RepID=A0AAV8THF1_9ROSI|nr:hypothetical protein K2173_014741 [Erythroxylum novogranatense]